MAVCPPELHEAFFAVVDRSGESAGVIIRALIGEVIDRARRGEPIVRGLSAAPERTEG